MGGFKRSNLATNALLLSSLTRLPLNHGPIIAVGASVEARTDIKSDIDHDTEKKGDADGNDVPDLHPDLNSGPEVDSTSNESTLPASLAKAVLVGAQRRSQDADGRISEVDHSMPSDETDSSDVKEGGTPRNTKPPLTGCVWGSPGCNKGKRNVAANLGTSINSSSVDEPEDNDLDAPTTSSFAGSAAAKIKAHVQEGRGVNSSNRKTPLSPMRNKMISRTNNNASEGESASADKHDSESSSHKPPQGFQLSARIVTSPSDGLSYFLDVPEDPNALELENWMMNIPYTYVECGPTVESTTDSFMLEDMVVRHFPHGAAMGHWVNLAGGITIDKSEGEAGGEREVYNNNNIDGHPKLLIALTSIEITVSGNDEETRTFYPGEVVLMEDTLGKGHKMRAARGTLDGLHSKMHGQDLKVLLVSLPHSVHYTVSDLQNYARHEQASTSKSSSSNNIETNAPSENPSPSSYSGAKHSIFGLVPKRHSRGKTYSDYRSASLVREDTKPCPLEYDSAYSSLFTPPFYQRRSSRRRRRNPPIGESAFSSEYPPPPGHSTYDEDSVLLRFLPSFRRTMLFGIGLTLTSSFVYCVQLMYPPLLVLFGGAAIVIGGATTFVSGMTWSYRQWLAVWEEEWRWRREMKRHREAEKERNGSKAGVTVAGDAAANESDETISSENDKVRDTNGVIED